MVVGIYDHIGCGRKPVGQVMNLLSSIGSQPGCLRPLYQQSKAGKQCFTLSGRGRKAVRPHGVYDHSDLGRRSPGKSTTGFAVVENLFDHVGRGRSLVRPRVVVVEGSYDHTDGECGRKA